MNTVIPILLGAMNTPPRLSGYHIDLSRRPTVNKSAPYMYGTPPNKSLHTPPTWDGQFESNASLEASTWKIATQGEWGVPLLPWDAQSNAQVPRLLFLLDGMLVVGYWDSLP